MSPKVKNKPKSVVYRKSLIKLLIVDHLKKLNRTWDDFLFFGGFSIVGNPNSPVVRRKRHKDILKA